MIIKYDNTMEDMIAFNQHYIETSPVQRKSLFSIRWKMPVLTLIFFGILSWSDHSFGFLIYGLVVAIVLFLVYPAMFRKRFAKNIRQLYAERGSKGVLGLHSLEIDDNGLLVKTDCNEVKSSWNTLDRIVSTDTHTFIYINANAAIILPRQTIVEGDYDNFVAELNRLYNNRIR